MEDNAPEIGPGNRRTSMMERGVSRFKLMDTTQSERAAAHASQVGVDGGVSLKEPVSAGEIAISKKKLNEVLGRLENPKLSIRNPVFDELLAQDGDTIVDRTQAIFYLLNLVSALMFNSFSGIALSPLPTDPEEYPGVLYASEVAIAYNTFSSIILMLNVVCTLLTTYILIALSAESQVTIFEFLLNEDGSTFIYFIITSNSAVLILLMVFCANYLSSGIWVATGIAGTLGVILLAMCYSFGAVQARLMPFQYSGWGVFASGGIHWTKLTKAKATIRGKKLATEARHNIFGTYEGIEDHDSDDDAEHAEVVIKAKASTQLMTLVTGALTKNGRIVKPERIADVAELLASHDIDMDVLAGMSEVLLMHALQGLEKGRIVITTGETLAIIQALHDQKFTKTT